MEQALGKLSKEELVKKCERLLVLGHKAKEAKNECAEELKRTKENEAKLSTDIQTLQEVFNAKTDELLRSIELHRAKTIENAQLSEKVQLLENRLAEKHQENILLHETLTGLNNKISDFETKSSEDSIQIKDYDAIVHRLELEKNALVRKNEELILKVKTSEEKYTLVDKKLVEFQDKYLDEKRQLAKLESLLEKKLDEKSEKSSTDRSESRDGLPTVIENAELEALQEKLNEAFVKIDKLHRCNLQLKEKCSNNDFLKEKLEKSMKMCQYYKENTCKIMENCLARCKELKMCSSKILIDYSTLEDKYKILEQEKIELIARLKEQSTISEELKILRERSENEKSLFRDLEASQLVNKELEGKVARLISDVRESETYPEQIASLSEQIEKLKKEKELILKASKKEITNNTCIEELQKQLELFKKETENLKISEQKSLEKKAEVEVLLNDANSKLDRLEKEIKNKSAELENAKEILVAEKDKEISSLSLRLASLENEQKCLLESNNELLSKSNKLTELEAEINTYKLNLASFKKEKELILQEKEELLTKLDNLQKENTQLITKENELITSQETIKLLKDELEELKMEKENTSKFVSELQVEKEVLEKAINEQVSNCNKIAQLENEVQYLSKELESSKLQADLKFGEMEEKLQQSSKLLEDFKSADNKPCEECYELKKKKEVYDGMVGQLERLRKDILNAKVFYETIKGEVALDLKSFSDEHKNLNENFSQVVGDFVTKLVENNAELLKEMNMMNQELKNRGATISKLTEEVSAWDTKHKESEVKLKKINDKLEEAEGDNDRLRNEIDTKDKSMRAMEEELWTVRNQDNHADTLSTSTISRVDESKRLEEIEDSFEDKYNKVKVLAVKLKKKVVDLQKQNEQDREKFINERNDIINKLNLCQNQTKAMKSLQDEYDKLQDLYDDEKKQSSDLRKSVDKAKEEVKALNKNIEEAIREREGFLREKNSFDIIKKELTGQIQSLKKVIVKEQEKIKDFDKIREQHEHEIKAMEKKLEEEGYRHRATLVSLEDVKSEEKKHSLLRLEIADYERSVNQLSKKLEAKDAQIQEIEDNLQTQRDLTKTLQDTVQELEKQLSTAMQVKETYTQKVSSLQDAMTEMRAELSSKMTLISEFERLNEERKLEAEKLTMEVASMSAEKVKLEEKNRSQQDQLFSQIRSLEDKVGHQQEVFQRKELELTELKKEFENYKVRSINVLRRSQKENQSSRQQDIEEEVKLLKNSSDHFRSKLEEELKKSQSLQDENQALLEEKTRLFQKVQDLTSLVAELRATNAQLQTIEQRVREEGEENAKLLKVQLETLAQVYKKEMEMQETNYKKEIEDIQGALELAEKKLHLHVDSGYQESLVHRRNLSSGKLETPIVEAAPGHRRQQSANFAPVKVERETLDVLMLEREACEGSESVDSTSPRLVPLDQLLSPPSISIDVSVLQERLEKCENRIKHLTALLSDAESDSARLQQLNEVLKEDIRRRERNEAREQHANNLEYLKNVVVKFATLPRGDERMRLVPVLNTILKLSPDEEARLSNAARVGAEAAGWGTYLGGIWSGGQ